MPWFHGKISREVAEKLLTPRTDGLFLVGVANVVGCQNSITKNSKLLSKHNQYLA